MLDKELTANLWLEETIEVEHARSQIKKFSLKSISKPSIQLFCKKNKITWNILIHTAWGLLLNRLSTSDHLLFGSATAIAKNGKVNHSPGILIKSTLSKKLTVKKLLKNIETQLAQRNTPLTRSKKQKKLEHLTPQVKYLLLTKTTKTANPSLLDTKRFPLALFIEDKPSEQFSILYHPSKFLLWSIENIATHFELILHELISNPNQVVCHINILTHNDKLLLSKWGHPKQHATLPPLSSSIHELFSLQAKNIPKQIAVQYDELSITYRDLDQSSTKLAGLLIKKGVCPQDRVCVLMDRTPTLIVVMLALFKISAIFVPINLKYPKERIEYVLEDSQTNCILVNRADKLPDKYAKKIFEIPAEFTKFSALITSTHAELNSKGKETVSESLITLPPGKAEQIAYIIYTSGTTGNPKGVMIKHKSLINLTDWYRACFKISKNDCASQFASQGFDTFFCETLPFLATGGCVCIVDDHTKLTPSQFFPWLQKHNITICDLPTAYAQMLFNLSWPTLPHLRIVKIGGESMTHYPTQHFSFDIWNSYGPTETTIEATYAKIYDAKAPSITKTSPRLHLSGSPPIGKPIANSEMYIVDKHFQLLPVGITGELLIGGEGLATGYWHRNDLTKEKFIDHPFQSTQDKLYRTGDLVRWLPDGNLEFIGRIDFQIKIRGFRIEPSEIESAISLHPDVNEVIVIAKKEIGGDKTLVAYVTPNLEKGRYLYQERCLLSLSNDKFVETITEDISKHGLAVSGVTDSFNHHQHVRVHFKLPGLTEAKTLPGHIIWQQDNRCGIQFDLNPDEKTMVDKSIDYYLSTHNIMEMVLSASAKRSLRKALRKKLPDYMIPAAFVTLMEFPLTFSGKIDTKALPPPHEFEKFFQKKYVAPRTETEKKLASLWSKLLKQATISLSDNFFDLGGTSLTAAELSIIILEQFHTSIPTHILFDLPYIPILAEYIDTKGKKYTSHSSVQDDIQHDAKLHDNILPSKHLSPHLAHPENILLTGAGGFLGIYLLKELLDQTDAKIHCIIRKGEFETAAKRLQATIEKFHLHNEISLSNRRIIAIAGDISFDRFGLPTEHYNHLAEKADLIYHCGAQVNIMTAYHKLRGSNVQGTIEIIKFATKKINKPIHYISTLSAAYLTNEEECLIEEFPTHQYENLFGGYAISKWISERLLTQVKDRGLPAVIYRSGYIGGHSKTGACNLNDALFMLIKGCIQMGYAPHLNEKITLLPVDFVSAVIARISLAYPDVSAVYHVDHPTGIVWQDLIAWLNDYGYKIAIIPLKPWQQKLSKMTQDNALFPFLPYYLAIKENRLSPEADTNRTRTILAQLNMSYPKIDDQLLTTYFKFFHQEHFILPPLNKKMPVK